MPIDGLMIAIADFLSVDLKYARILIEVTGLVVILLIGGGSLGAGTVIITVTMGYLVSISRNFAEKKLKI